MSAAEYSGKPHTILQIETESLASQYIDNIELAHMNTGSTRPYPHPRGRSTFRTMDQYPYELRRRLPDSSAVVELTVAAGVAEIQRHVLSVEHASSGNGHYKVHEVLFRAGV